MTVEELSVVITANTAGVRSEVDKAKNKIQEFSNSAGKSGESVKKGFATVSKAAAGVGLAVGAALVAVGVKAVSFTEDFHKALNGLQTATGATDAEMVGFKKTMVSLYNQNYGANFEEIAQAMKEVKTQTGLSGKALEDMTKKAFLLKDTFGFEIKDSVTSATAMMKQFGISGDDAYELIAQGAQNGLDKNGDMLDTINEYSGSFKGAGFSATEMMNMLVNGAKSGAFSVDKLGDSMKEFGIRSKDGSKATSDAFKALGLDSDKMTKAFGAGGEAGKKAFTDVNAKLLAMKDPIKQNALGVQLYGTQWEDLGVKGIEALTKTQGGIDKTKDKMKGIEKIKYNTFSEGLKGVGRIITTSILIPIGEKLIPKLQEFSQWITDNMPTIKQNINTAMDSIGPIIDKVVEGVKKFIDIFVKVAGFISKHQVAFTNIAIVIASVVVAFNLVAGVLAIVSGAMTAFGIVLAFVTSPIGLIVLAIAAVIAIGVLLWKNWDVIKAKAITIFTGIWTTIKAIFTPVVAFFKLIWEGIKLVFTVVAVVLVAFFLLAWDGIKAIWNLVKPFFQAIWDGIKAVFSVVKDVLVGFFKLAWEGIKVVWDVVTDFFSGIWTGIKNVFSAIGTWFKNIFTEAWAAIKGVFAPVGAFFAGIWKTIKSKFSSIGSSIGSTIGGAFKTVVNSIINFAENTINGFIRAINRAIKLINKIPGVNIGTVGTLSIPRLARGGIVDSATIFMAGEHGKEVVMPLEHNTGWIDELANKLNSNNNNGGNGLSLNIENFANNRSQDIESLAEELSFYMHQKSLGGSR